MEPIYLDYNATTPIDPAVAEAMLPYLREHFGNPSSGHVYGRRAHDAVDVARSQVADLLGAQPYEIVFTSGGTEANNHALKGIALQKMGGFFGRLLGNWHKPHLITSVIEHPAIVQPCRFLKSLGCRITQLPVDRHGRVDPDAVRRALAHGASLVSIMHSNNEVGTLQPIAEIAKICREHGVPCHTDAAQSIGKVPVDVERLGVDLLTVAGHKVYAPKGVGALYVRRGLSLEPILHGADHESGRRAGTENVPYLAGLGEACRLAKESLPAATDKLRALRDRLRERLQSALGDRVTVNGHPDERLPNTLNVSFRDRVGAELLDALPEIAASTGSACHEGQVQVSGVLSAMGVRPEQARGAVRLSVGRFTTEAEIDRASDLFAGAASEAHAGR